MSWSSTIYDSQCTDCKLFQTAREVCEPGFGNPNGDVIVVSKMHNSGTYQDMIEEALTKSGLSLDRVFFTAALKCRTFDQDSSTKDVKACAKYLQSEMEEVKPKWVLTFGNEPLQSATGHSGITKYRGRVLDQGSYKVVPTVSPAAVQRNPGQRQSWEADVQFFVSQVLGRSTEVSLPKVAFIDTTDKLKSLIRVMAKAELISYDIETTRASEFEAGAAIVSLAGTLVLKSGRRIVFAIPLYHPESPYRTKWRSLLRNLAPHLERIPKQVAHNGKFDARWLRHFGVQMRVTFDTMLAAHLLDENRQKGLKPLARVLLGVPPWEISTRDLLSTPIQEVLKYNALDTYYTYHIYLILRQQLIEQPRLLRLFQLVTIPSAEILIDVERTGVWIDPEKLATAHKISFDMRDEIDRQLMEYVPDPETTEGWPTNSKGKQVEVNFNASNFAKWWLFEYLDFEIFERGKTKDDGSPGAPSMAEATMLELEKTDHPVIKLLLERSKWQKYCSTYVSKYIELSDENNRIRSTFKLHGTVTGRLSSGKADDDKLSGSAKTNIRGVNLQQVPRDPFIRGLFGAPPGSSFVEADFSQVELRVVAYLARDKTMLRIYQMGQDIHTATAASVLGVPLSQVSKDDRKKAKAINFGFVYGMGAPKFVSTAFEKYGAIFSLDEARDIRKAFFAQFSGLLPWHARQRRLVQQYGRVQSPLGRVRHLPDVYSQDSAVVGEAERQAINSPVQSFASDMNLLSMILIQRQFEQLQIPALVLGTVHDAINFEIKDEALSVALPIIKTTMETLPLKKKFGLDLDVPVIADIKVGSHWGDAREIPEEEVYNWKG